MTDAGQYSFAIAYGEGEGQPASSSFFMTLGITRGPLFFAAAEGLRGSITSQIAVKMSTDAFLERSLDAAAAPAGELPQATLVVREAFKEANNRVYQYGHRMGRGGSMGALGAVACYAANRFTMARVGSYSGFLFRGGELVALFEGDAKREADKAGVLARFIGANAQVLVDQASLEVHEGDVLVFSTYPAVPALSAALVDVLGEKRPLADRAKTIVQEICAADPELAGKADVLALLHLGRPTIVLRDVVE